MGAMTRGLVLAVLFLGIALVGGVVALKLGLGVPAVGVLSVVVPAVLAGVWGFKDSLRSDGGGPSAVLQWLLVPAVVVLVLTFVKFSTGRFDTETLVEALRDRSNWTVAGILAAPGFALALIGWSLHPSSPRRARL